MGLAFISLGDSSKLKSFLDLNPDVPRQLCFVDDSREFLAYEAAGFGKIGSEAMPKSGLRPPGLSLSQWFKYLINVLKLSPIRKDAKLGEFPEGVLRLGGTFVLKGEEVVYKHSDRIPGDYPNVEDVIKAAEVQ